MASVARLGEDLLAGAHERISLFAMELREEKAQQVQSLVWAGAFLLLSLMALVFVSLTLVYFFWERARLEILGSLALIYSLAALAVLVRFRLFLARQPDPFAATLKELRADQAAIRGSN